jgi:hypothetical protein
MLVLTIVAIQGFTGIILRLSWCKALTTSTLFVLLWKRIHVISGYILLILAKINTLIGWHIY